MIALLFPGQGSQFKGMGEGLFDLYPEISKEADEILGYSIQELCEQDPEDKITLTQYAQPAIYTVNALKHKQYQSENSNPANFLAGHSLGEYNALLAAGAFDFGTGLKLVKKRGEIMAKAENGSMAAVVGMTEDEIKEVLNNNLLFNLDIANINAPGQIVISGRKNDIVIAQKIFEENGAKAYIPLNVSGAFHSRFMNNSMLEFTEFIETFDFNNLNQTVISNIEAKPYTSENAKYILSQQINNPVLWEKSMNYILQADDEIAFKEIGEGSILTNMLTRIKRKYNKATAQA